jgi:hypothetical protein
MTPNVNWCARVIKAGRDLDTAPDLRAATSTPRFTTAAERPKALLPTAREEQAMTEVDHI